MLTDSLLKHKGEPFRDLCWLIRLEAGRARTGLTPSFYLALLRREAETRSADAERRGLSLLNTAGK